MGFDDIEGGLRGDGWNLEAWHTARMTAFERARRHLEQHARLSMDNGRSPQRCCVVILDDNMYYRR